MVLSAGGFPGHTGDTWTIKNGSLIMENGNHPVKIVVGVDGSEASIEALREAQRLAGSLKASVVAMACWDYPRM